MIQQYITLKLFLSLYIDRDKLVLWPILQETRIEYCNGECTDVMVTTAGIG